MKKSVLVLSTLLLSTSAFAQVAANNNFVGKAFNLLINKARIVRLEGDVRAGERLKPAMNQLVSHIRSFKTGTEDKSGIKAFDMTCEQYRLAAKCVLVVDKAIGSQAYTFMVGYDTNKMPESILENRVSVAKGD